MSFSHVQIDGASIYKIDVDSTSAGPRVADALRKIEGRPRTNVDFAVAAVYPALEFPNVLNSESRGICNGFGSCSIHRYT